MPEGGLMRGRLLAVDDCADSAGLVARVAAKCGYEAQATSDPMTVKALVVSWRPEVLTLDLCMPEADGIDLLAVLEEAGFNGLLVIISGQDGWFRKAASRLAETRGLRVVDDLQKPVDIAALRALLSRLRQDE
jgi:two-component system chemotaxis response regulator CheB